MLQSFLDEHFKINKQNPKNEKSKQKVIRELSQIKRIQLISTEATTFSNQFSPLGNCLQDTFVPGKMQ